MDEHLGMTAGTYTDISQSKFPKLKINIFVLLQQHFTVDPGHGYVNTMVLLCKKMYKDRIQNK